MPVHRPCQAHPKADGNSNSNANANVHSKANATLKGDQKVAPGGGGVEKMGTQVHEPILCVFTLRLHNPLPFRHRPLAHKPKAE